MTLHSHESLTSFRAVSGSSDRKFGLTVGAILVALALWPVVRHHQPARLWLLAIGVVLVGFGIVYPSGLAWLNKAWFQLGLLLAKATNPIVMGVMYFAVVVPFGLIIRMRGRDLLRLKRDATCESYWILRDRDAPKSSLSKQY